MLEKILKKSLVGICLLAPVLSLAQNLVDNGSFEHGQTGWTTDYAYVSNANAVANKFGPNGMWAEGTVTVGANPNDFHSLWSSYGAEDGNNMLIVNGSPTAGQNVWKSTLLSSLASGTTYQFTAWVHSSYPDSPAQLDFKVGGVDLGTTTVSGSSWQLISKTFTGINGTAVSGVIDLNIARGGNDFAIDNIQVRAVPEPFTMVLGASALGLAARRRLVKKVS